MLQETNAITVGEVIPSTNTSLPRCELVVNGKPIGRYVTGCVLETAFQCDAGYLVFLTEDYLFEDALSIYLLDFSGAIQDSANFSSWFGANGSFEIVKLQQPDSISFKFFHLKKYKGDTIWTLHMPKNPIFRVPFISGQMCIQRPFGFKRHFIITETGTGKIHAPVVELLSKIVNSRRFRNR